MGAYETAPAIMLACEGDDMVLASANEAARVAFGEALRVRQVDARDGSRGRSTHDGARHDMVDTVYATGRPITQSAHRRAVWARTGRRSRSSGT